MWNPEGPPDEAPVVIVLRALQARGERAVGSFVQPAAVGEFGQLRAQRFQLAARRHLQAQLLADTPDLHRAVGSLDNRQDLAVVAGQRGLIESLAAVRDQQDRPATGAVSQG